MKERSPKLTAAQQRVVIEDETLFELLDDEEKMLVRLVHDPLMKSQARTGTTRPLSGIAKGLGMTRAQLNAKLKKAYKKMGVLAVAIAKGLVEDDDDPEGS